MFSLLSKICILLLFCFAFNGLISFWGPFSCLVVLTLPRPCFVFVLFLNGCVSLLVFICLNFPLSFIWGIICLKKNCYFFVYFCVCTLGFFLFVFFFTLVIYLFIFYCHTMRLVGSWFPSQGSGLRLWYLMPSPGCWISREFLASEKKNNNNNGESSPGNHNINYKTQLHWTVCRLQYCMPQVKQHTRQEHKLIRQ